MVRCAQLLTVMTVLIVLSATASAASLTVGPGEMYTTIQEAVDAADPGDTIIVMPGEYTEDVVITKENITLRSSPVQGAALNGTITVEEQGVVIDGFEIFPQDESGVRGTESGISVTVTNSVIFGTGVGAKELVDEAEVKTDGQMTVIGDTPIGISIEANDALTASIVVSGMMV